MTERVFGRRDAYRLPAQPETVGGEAAIYAAHAEADGAPVAVRVALDELAGATLEGQAAWLRGAGAHPRCAGWVIPIWDDGRWAGRRFMVLDWCPTTLHSACSRYPHSAVSLLRRWCEAVDALHAAGFVHGDLKATNVLVRDPDTDPWPLLADPAFGTSFTPTLAAPERVHGEPASPESDRWSVGAVVRELIEAGLLRSNPTLQVAVRALLHPDPQRRPADLSALAAALNARTERPPYRRGAAAAAVLLAMSAFNDFQPHLVRPPCPTDLTPMGEVCLDRDGAAFARVPAGSARLGRRAQDDRSRLPDAAPHQVTLTKGFLLGVTEVSQAEWAALAGARPVATRHQTLDGGVDAPCEAWKGHALVSDAFPVVCVSWLDAVRWLNARSERDGLQPAYRFNVDDPLSVRWDRGASGWRLPTEAEWEYAARRDGAHDDCRRANTRDQSAPEHWGNEAPCDDGAPVLTAPRSAYRSPNGLFHMQGNALEWVWDRYGPLEALAPVDPVGPSHGAARVLKGGSWNHVPRGPAARYASAPNTWSYTTGLRIARNLD